MSVWPNQSDVRAFYGDPRDRNHAGEASAAWECDNLVNVWPPFGITYDGQPVKRIKMHRKCAASFGRVLDHYRDLYSAHSGGHWPVMPYGGSYCFRLIRGGNTLSMHAYGCAIDFDVEHNPMGRLTPGGFTDNSPLVQAFKAEGWAWGGDWTGRPDPMHFQAARV